MAGEKIKLNKHIFHFDNIVVGGSLDALLYSYFTHSKCIFVKDRPPFEFDNLDESLKERFGVETERELWERLIFSLSLEGLLPLSDKAATISITDKEVKAVSHNSRLFRFSFDKMVVFDDEGISGLPLKEETKNQKVKVADWFHVHSGMKHDHWLLESGDDFVNQIIFYPSKRYGKQKPDTRRKDLVSVSYIDEKELKEFDYSNTMVKFKVLEMMKEAGIKGARNGRDQQNPEKYKYYAVKVEHVEREILHKPKATFKKDERFEFYPDVKSLICENKRLDKIYNLLVK